MRRYWPVLVIIAPLSCSGSTGYELVSFYAAAGGPPDSRAGRAYTFASGGFEVALTRAVIHIGALYLDQSLPTSGAAEGRCTVPGTYVGEVREGRDVDMLDPSPQFFPSAGLGSTIPAAIGQVWLTGGNPFGADATHVLSIAGTATRGSLSIPFSGEITIDQNRSPAAVANALPGAHPLCEQRIVTPILTNVSLAQGGTLLLHLDPKSLFTNVDFSALPRALNEPTSYAFSDDSSDQPSANLYANLRGGGGVYGFEFLTASH